MIQEDLHWFSKSLSRKILGVILVCLGWGLVVGYYW